MALDPGVLELIRSLYDAAMDESQWPAVLAKIADFTGSQAATFWVLDSSAAPRLPTFTYINLHPSLIKEYLEGMAGFDPTVQYLVSHPRQAIVHDGLFITEREKDRHPYYDWHHRYTDMRFRLIGQMSPAPGLQAGVALHRARHVGGYERCDVERLGVLHGHLERALAISFRLGALGATQAAAFDLLDRNPAAAFLLDERLRVVYRNRSAAELCAASDGIRFAAGGLTLLRKADDDRLRRLVAEARSILASSAPPPTASVGTMRAARPSGKRPYAILVAPVASPAPAVAALRPAVWIVVSDPEAETPLPTERLRLVFGLTEAEAGLAALIGAGDDLRTAAHKLRITYGTARARLAEIFSKTGTCRQGELIKVLLTTVALT